MADRPTRSQHLAALITDAVLQSRMQWNAYACAVATHYLDNVALPERDVEFQLPTTAVNFERIQRNNTQTVRRILSGERRMDVDIEESLIAALPQLQREAVQGALLARDGLMLARLPPLPEDKAGHVASACELMRSSADAVERIAPMLQTGGGIGPEDAQHASAAMDGLNKVVGACLTLGALIANAAVGKPAARKRSHDRVTH